MTNSRTLTAGSALLLALVTAAAAHALPGPEQTTYLTFDRSVALPGVTLNAGSYVFEKATPLTSHNVVRVLSRDRRRVVFQAFTELVERPRGWRDDRFIVLGESEAGAPEPILAWYPLDASHGHQFLYR